MTEQSFSCPYRKGHLCISASRNAALPVSVDDAFCRNSCLSRGGPYRGNDRRPTCTQAKWTRNCLKMSRNLEEVSNKMLSMRRRKTPVRLRLPSARMQQQILQDASGVLKESHVASIAVWGENIEQGRRSETVDLLVRSSDLETTLRSWNEVVSEFPENRPYRLSVSDAHVWFPFYDLVLHKFFVSGIAKVSLPEEANYEDMETSLYERAFVHHCWRKRA